MEIHSDEWGGWNLLTGPPSVPIPWRSGEKRIVNAPVDGEAHVYHLDLSTAVVESYTEKRPTWYLIEDPTRGLWWRLGYFDLDQLVWFDGINATKDTVRVLMTRKPFGQGGERTKTIIHQIDKEIMGEITRGGLPPPPLSSLSLREGKEDATTEKSCPPPTPQPLEQISAPSDDVQEEGG